jgi:hypothetical protein
MTPRDRFPGGELSWVRVVVGCFGLFTGAGGAAAILGLNPSTLNSRIAKLGLRQVVDRIRSSRSPTKRR